MRIWRRREPPRVVGDPNWVGVLGMSLQCEVCGVPVESVRIAHRFREGAWVENRPCLHQISATYERIERADQP